MSALAVGLALAGCGDAGRQDPSAVASADASHTTSAMAASAAAGARSPSAAAPAVADTTSSVAGSVAAGCRPAAKPAPKLGLQMQPPTGDLDASLTYTVTLKTNCGDIKIALAVHQAPKTAASFAHLVREGFYDDLTFHRVVPGFVIQGGDPHGNGTGGPGYQVVEAPPSNLQYTNGVVAMAKTETDPPGASGSQFFIVVGANVHLPPEYAYVGNVVAGEDTAHKIADVPTETGPGGERGSIPAEPVVIESATLSSS